MAQNDSFDSLEKWRGGVEFCFAWHRLADPYALQKYRNTTTRGALEAEQMMMVAELWAGLRDGEFEAFGKCVAPEISNGPVLIPAHTFEFEPPRGIEDSNDFEISGWRYEGVKVVRVRESDADDEAAPDIKSEPEPIADAVTSEPIAPVGRKRGGGRPDTYQYSESVLRALYAIDGNSKLSAEKLHPAFAVEFQRQFPRDQYQSDPPTVRTFRDQIKRYRQELAETGNN